MTHAPSGPGSAFEDADADASPCEVDGCTQAADSGADHDRAGRSHTGLPQSSVRCVDVMSILHDTLWCQHKFTYRAFRAERMCRGSKGAAAWTYPAVSSPVSKTH